MKKTHGESFSVSRTPEYVAWLNMIARCERPEHARYAGRGIKVCEKWRESFDAFLSDVGRRPSAQHSLDRVDSNGNYEPTNVRWATEETQQRNRTNNRVVTVGGDKKCLAEWSAETGVNRKTLARRLDTGVAADRAVDPSPLHRLHDYNGEKRSLREIAKAVGIPESSLHRRLQRHGSVETAIAEWSRNGRGKRQRG